MDIDALMQPLAGPHGPCGEDMMFSPEFDQIQEARRFDDPSLSQGEWITDVKEADWPHVVRVSTTLLATRSKDLRVAAWLSEALAKTRGLGGLADGYRLLGELCAQWWPVLHPVPEDGDMSERIGTLDWLVTRTARLIRDTPLTRSAKGQFSLLDLASAQATAANIERDPAAADTLAQKAQVTLEQFDMARRDTPAAHYASVLTDLDALAAAMTTFKDIVDGALGDDAPAFGATFDTVDELRQRCQRYANDAGLHTPSAVPPPTDPEITEVRMQAGASSGPIRTRAEAIRQLNDIAAFFKQTEPHSPVAYLAEKAARWGNMSLHEWLRAVVKDEGALSQMEDLLGVAPATSAHDEGGY
ncbi:type VI secretion system protein TssA [Denitromonas sp.]|uniref:type VI secretion system protein TssA n=1 Tax=Denitromonas sp. TaxID=2734609 RepID=UPI003A8A8C52